MTVDFNESGAEEAVVELDGQGLGKGLAERRLACAWVACNKMKMKKPNSEQFEFSGFQKIE